MQVDGRIISKPCSQLALTCILVTGSHVVSSEYRVNRNSWTKCQYQSYMVTCYQSGTSYMYCSLSKHWTLKQIIWAVLQRMLLLVRIADPSALKWRILDCVQAYAFALTTVAIINVVLSVFRGVGVINGGFFTVQAFIPISPGRLYLFPVGRNDCRV